MPLPGGENKSSTSAISLLWCNLQDAFSRRFSSEKSGKRDRLILLLLTSFILTVLISPHHHDPSTLYKSGQIAVSDVRASRDYLVEDHKLTQEKQSEAAAKTPIIYSYDNRVQ